MVCIDATIDGEQKMESIWSVPRAYVLKFGWPEYKCSHGSMRFAEVINRRRPDDCFLVVSLKSPPMMTALPCACSFSTNAVRS